MNTTNLNNLIHGRETYAVYYGDGFVQKRPLPTLGPDARKEWLKKQHRTKDTIDAIRAVGNPVYNVPEMIFINDTEYNILEERALGRPLNADLYASLSRRQCVEIINSIASFLVDMNELKPIGNLIRHKIADDIKFARLDNFVENKMSHWFTNDEVRQMASVRDAVGTFEYETRMAWSHCDLNPGNVLYDPKTSKISFIDFAEANYNFIYRDIFAPLQIELGIYKRVYELYSQLHDASLYPMPGPKNPALREIMQYRIMGVLLKRFIKASDDLRMNPTKEKTIANNAVKVEFMRQQMRQMATLQQITL